MKQSMKYAGGEEHGCLDARSMIGAENDDDGVCQGEVYKGSQVARCHFKR
jgi:hypothetical protein